MPAAFAVVVPIKVADCARLLEALVPVIAEVLVGGTVVAVTDADVAGRCRHPGSPEQLTDRNTVAVAAPSPPDARTVYACRGVNAMGEPDNVPYFLQEHSQW